MSALNAGQGLRGNPPKGPPAHPCSWGWPAGGSSEKCGRGSEVPLRRWWPGLGQMVRIAPLRGLHGSGPDALRPRRVGWGTAGAGGGTGSAPAVSLFLPPPPRGMWARGRWSPVHGAPWSGAPCPAPRSLPPGRALPLSSSRSLSLTPWLPGSRLFSFLGFLLLFFRLLLVSLPFPHSPVRPLRLS